MLEQAVIPLNFKVNLTSLKEYYHTLVDEYDHIKDNVHLSSENYHEYMIMLTFLAKTIMSL